MHEGDEGGKKPPSTTTSAGAQLAGLAASEPVIGLRIWETSYEHVFPDHFDQLVVGRGANADIRLDWPTVTTEHALIERSGPHILVRDRSSKNHTFCDGLALAVFQLVAGAVVRFGTIDTVAFNRRTQEVRAGFRRFLGYGHGGQRAIEEAQWAATRRHIALIADKESAPVTFAQYIHNAAPAFKQRPFTIVTGEAGADGVVNRVPADFSLQKSLLDRTAYGTLVVHVAALPEKAEHRARFFGEVAADAYKLRMVLIVPPSVLAPTSRSTPTIEEIVGSSLRDKLVDVRIPALTERRPDELPRILEDTIAHLAPREGATAALFTDHDHECLDHQRWPGGLAEIEDTITRLLLVRKHGKHGGKEAAKQQKVGKSAISMWATKYGFRLKPERT